MLASRDVLKRLLTTIKERLGDRLIDGNDQNVQIFSQPSRPRPWIDDTDVMFIVKEECYRNLPFVRLR